MYSGKLSQPQLIPSDSAVPGMSSTPSMSSMSLAWSVGDLPVVVCVNVDETRGDDGAVRIDGLGGGAVALADVDDPTVLDAYVARVPIPA